MAAEHTGPALPSAPVITRHPDAAVGTPNGAFSFHAPGADGYRCRTFPADTAEGARPADGTCTGGSAGTHVVTGRADGEWTFEVLATDEDGDGPSAAHDWTVTSDPVVQRHESCERRNEELVEPGTGWMFNSQRRLDRGRNDVEQYPG